MNVLDPQLKPKFYDVTYPNQLLDLDLISKLLLKNLSLTAWFASTSPSPPGLSMGSCCCKHGFARLSSATARFPKTGQDTIRIRAQMDKMDASWTSISDGGPQARPIPYDTARSRTTRMSAMRLQHPERRIRIRLGMRRSRDAPKRRCFRNLAIAAIAMPPE